MDANEILRAWLRGTFLRYQLKWILDDSLVASILKGRQLGLTDASAARCILGGFRDGRPQIVLSAAQANANLLLDAVRTHCRFLAKIGLPEAEDFAVDNSEEIRWRSGGSVIALAANPRTARSFHGDLTLDEFAYHQDAEGIWAAAAPMTTRGDWKVRVVSTPNGAQGLFYEWCKSPPKGWTMHTVSLADAERDGLVVDRSRLLALVGGDARVFGEAYECKFLDGDLQYFPTPLVDAARHWIGRTPDLSGAELYAGLDVGRHHDLTVLTIVAVVGGVAWVVAVLTAKRTAFKAQRKLLFEAREKLGWTKLVVDKSGLGEQFAEELVELWGEDEVIPIAFTAPMKAVLATGAFQWLQRGAVRFPKGEEGRRLHEETVAVRRIVTPAGNVTYVSPRTLEGHGDRAWSLFCALFAASGAEIPRGMGDEPLFAVA
jgi:phage FluMu gp28-like protein